MNNNLEQLPLTLCLSKATLAAGTTTTVSTTGTTTYIIRNKLYTKAAVTNGATPTTDAVTGAAFRAITANQVTVVVVFFTTGGAIKAAQGGIETLPSSGVVGPAPQFPSVPDDCCPIGYILCKAGATLSGSWTFGSSNLSSVTGMTWVIQDIANIPDRPQAS